jgi:RHS repeat-associated protein
VARQYYLRDHLGSVRVTINEASQIIHHDDYYPFGLSMPGRSMVTAVPKETFTGHELDDESGFYYAGARYLDPVMGRWMSVDPLADKYPEWSPFNYVANNPLIIIDPNGTDWYCTTSDSGDCVSYQWDDKLTAENASEHLSEGQKYIAYGTTYTAYNGLTVQLSENQEWSYLDSPESVRARVATGQLDGNLLTANAKDLSLELQAAVGAGLVLRGQAAFLDHPITQGTITGLSFLVGGGYFQLGVKATYYPRAKGVGVVVTRAHERLISLDAHFIRLGGRKTGRDLFLPHIDTPAAKHIPWKQIDKFRRGVYKWQK